LDTVGAMDSDRHRCVCGERAGPGSAAGGARPQNRGRL